MRDRGLRRATASPTARARDAAMAAWLVERGVGLVVLAGYMQLLSPAFLARFPQRVINVHPALLPAFPGIGAVEQALAYGVKVVRRDRPLRRRGRRHRARSSSSARSTSRRRPRPTRCARALRPDRARAAVRGGAADRPRRGPDRPRPPAARADRVLIYRPAPMTQPGEVRIRRAVLSVSDKTGIVEFARGSPTSASRSSPPAARPRRSRPPGSRSARSTTSRASPRSWAGASRRCTRSSTPACSPAATTRRTWSRRRSTGSSSSTSCA